MPDVCTCAHTYTHIITVNNVFNNCLRAKQFWCRIIVLEQGNLLSWWNSWTILRQEINGPQTDQFLICEKKFHNIRWWRRLVPDQIRHKKPHSPHSQREGDPFNYKCTEGLLGDLKNGGPHLIVSYGNYPLASLLESTMVQRCMWTHRRP